MLFIVIIFNIYLNKSNNIEYFELCNETIFFNKRLLLSIAVEDFNKFKICIKMKL